MRVIRNTGQNVSPSDDGRLYDKAFTDGLFNSPSITSLGANLVQIGSIYGILCGRDFTADAQQINVELPTADTATGYIYIKYDTATDDIISVESALAPFTVTYEDINTSGTVCEMIIATYTASQVAVTSLTANYPKAQTEVNETLAGSIATIETSPATANHSVGEYIVYNGQLYKVTSAITAGTTLTGKISAVSVGSEIASLNSGSMQNRKLLGSGTPTANTSYALNESVSNYKYVEIILVKNGGNGGAFANKLVNIDNIGMGNVETLALSVYNTASYHLHMECGFESATSFKIASYTCVGWTMSNVYIVGVSK